MVVAVKVIGFAVLVFVGLSACSSQADLDKRAEAVRERLGPICRSFDFQAKTEANGAVYRPVDCKTDEGVVVRIVAFEDEEHLRASSPDISHPEGAVSSGSPGPYGIVIDDKAATVTVYDRSLIEKVEERVAD